MTEPTDFIERYREAVAALDVTAMLELYADDVRVFDAMEPAEHPDRASWAHQVEEWFGSLESGSVDFEELEVIETDDLAVVTGLVTYGGTFPGGQPAELVGRITWVLKRDGETWQILHEHNSVPISTEDDDDDEGADEASALDDFGDPDDDHDDDDNEFEDETGLAENDDVDVEARRL